MFEVRCIVADKHLSKVLRLLSGITLEPPVTLAVDDTEQPGAPRKSGKKSPKGEAFPVMQKFLSNKAKGDLVSAKEMRDHFVSLGYPQGGYSYALTRALMEKLLKRRDRGMYERTGE